MNTFRSRDFASLPIFPTRDTIGTTIENTALQPRYQSITTGKHRALIVSSSIWAAWQQRSWVQRPIGPRGRSLAMTKITSTEHDYSILPTIEIAHDPLSEVWIQFLQVNWARSSVGEPTIDGVILPLNAPILRTQREVKRQFMNQHSYNYIHSNRVKRTYCNWCVHLQL
jgi:hypothetical protein